MEPRAFKNAAYEQVARVGKALSSPTRLELLDLLAQGPKSVELLARECGQTIANTSQHLQTLRGARLVEVDRHGVQMIYRLADPTVEAMAVALRTVASARLLEIADVTRRFEQERGSLEAVDQADLLGRVRAGEVTVIDVRTAEEYASGHLPGALSVPVAELEARLTELPSDRQIVAYCRGPWCVFAIDAVRTLQGRGLDAVRLEAGVSEWRARGWAVEADT